MTFFLFVCVVVWRRGDHGWVSRHSACERGLHAQRYMSTARDKMMVHVWYFRLFFCSFLRVKRDNTWDGENNDIFYFLVWVDSPRPRYNNVFYSLFVVDALFVPAVLQRAVLSSVAGHTADQPRYTRVHVVGDAWLFFFLSPPGPTLHVPCVHRVTRLTRGRSFVLSLYCCTHEWRFFLYIVQVKRAKHRRFCCYRTANRSFCFIFAPPKRFLSFSLCVFTAISADTQARLHRACWIDTYSGRRSKKKCRRNEKIFFLVSAQRTLDVNNYFE